MAPNQKHNLPHLNTQPPVLNMTTLQDDNLNLMKNDLCSLICIPNDKMNETAALHTLTVGVTVVQTPKETCDVQMTDTAKKKPSNELRNYSSLSMCPPG